MPSATIRKVTVRGFSAFAPLGLAALALSTGCPGEISLAPNRAAAEPAVGPDDPRVVQDGNDLYSAAELERMQARTAPEDEDVEGPGTGRPDETNGICRLYAPKLPDPTCCEIDYGFDVATVKRLCGHDVYLGESFQFSCGYYFHRETSDPPWFRMSFLPFATVEKAAEAHDGKLRGLVGDGAPTSQPVPGVEGAMWSHHGEHHWAFIPGWSKVRQLAWRNESCSDDGMVQLIKQIVAAKEPPEGAERLALVPKARTE